MQDAIADAKAAINAAINKAKDAAYRAIKPRPTHASAPTSRSTA
jgi:hypothetical protein